MKITLITLNVLIIVVSAIPLITDQIINGNQSGTVWWYWVGLVLFLIGLVFTPAYFLLKWIFKW